MRKKLVAVSMALVALLVFTACGGGGKVDEAAKGKFNEGLEKTQSLKSVDLDLDADVTLKAGSQELTMKMGAIRQADFKNEKKPEERVSVNMEGAGQNMKVDMYYKDGYMYMTSQGQKFKVKISYEEATGVLEKGQSNVGGINIKADAFSSLSMKEDGDNTTFEYAIDPKNSDALKELQESIVGNVTEQLQDGDVEITDFKGTATTNKDGYLSAQTISLVMKVKAQGQSADMKMDMNLKYNNAGQDVKVTPMTGLNSYIEIDKSRLG